MSRIIRNFAVFQDGSNLLRWATVIAQNIVWAFFHVHTISAYCGVIA